MCDILYCFVFSTLAPDAVDIEQPIPPLPLGGNAAGECHDCYYGGIDWKQSGTKLNIGVFPYMRHASFCSTTDLHGSHTDSSD